MPIYHILILAIVQGLTEFLPISSSGHLVVAHNILNGGSANLCWEQNRMMDVAVHVGTLFSVLLYFRKDIMMILKGLTNTKSEGFKLAYHLVVASIPVIIIGFTIQMLQLPFLCLLEVMAWMTLIFGIVLIIADRFEETKTIKDLNFKHSFVIGLSQAIALIPGVSRSGITMTSARFLGYSRIEAARFSMLLSIIAISGAGVLSGWDLFGDTNLIINIDVLIAVVFSFLSGLISIILMMKWLSHASFKPFGIYRIIMGLALLIAIYGGFM